MDYHKHFKMNSMLRYITLTLFIAITTISAESLKANYDKSDYKFFNHLSKSPLHLQCQASSDSQELKWLKDGKDVHEIEKLKDRFKISDKGTNFIITNTMAEDAGKYTCTIPEKNIQADINVVASPKIRKIPNISVVEGEKLKIHCDVLGLGNPQITWTIDDTTLPNSNRSQVTMEKDSNGNENAVLVIEHVSLSDRGEYNCTVRNAATEFNITAYPPATEGSYVRIKGKLAALWPFLGICAEVIILCAIILVYEKRRNKEGLDESDTDQSPEQEKLKTGK